MPGFRVRRRRDNFDPRASRCEASPRSGTPKSSSSWDGDRDMVMRRPIYLPCPSTPYRDRSGLQPENRPIMPSADFYTVVRTPCATSVPKDTMQISRSKPDSLHRAPAGFTKLVLMDMDFAVSCRSSDQLPRNPISVRQVAILLHASFRQFLAVLPCASLVLHLHQVAQGLHPQLPDMSDTQVLATLASPPATCALAPPFSPAPMLRHVVLHRCCTSELKRAHFLEFTRSTDFSNLSE